MSKPVEGNYVNSKQEANRSKETREPVKGGSMRPGKA